LILRTKGGQRAQFAAFDSSVPIPRPSQWGGSLSYAGQRVTYESAVGLPAFLRGVRLICETSAGFPIRNFREGQDGSRRPMPVQPYLRRPNINQSPFQAWSYVFASMLRGNAYIWKVKVGRAKTIKQLYPLNPVLVTPKYEGDRPTFEIRERPLGPVVKTVGADTIIHIPGVLVEDPFVGESVVVAHRHGIGTALARQEFEGRYLANDGSPGVVLHHEGHPTEEQRTAIRAGYEAKHAGPSNAGRVGLMWGGWSIDKTAVSLEDAQFIESQQFTVQDIGRMLGVPAGLLGDPNAPGSDTPEQENMRFLTYGLRPWTERVEQGLANDPDLFPEPDWQVEFDPSRLLMADIQTRWDAYRLGRQGGWITANEIRAKEGLEARPDGDEIQVTPVGGAANPTQDGGSTTNG
jgi:HK97 family phage portal protein